MSPHMEQIIAAYLKHVRPHCFCKRGLVQSVDVAELAPLFVRPLTGARLAKVSPYLSAHILATLGVYITCTRFRSIVHTRVTELCTTKEREAYETCDGHTAAVAKQVSVAVCSFRTCTVFFTVVFFSVVLFKARPCRSIN